MSEYAKYFTTRQTPQKEPVAGKDQVENAEGGYVFRLDPWKTLDRFLVLGTTEGTFYVRPRELTREAAAGVHALLVGPDATRAVDRIVEISVSGRAHRASPVIFALAMACAVAPIEARRRAIGAVQTVCRTATHLFEFLEASKAFRGRGRGLRAAVRNWYTGRGAASLAHQMLKYRHREKWTHADALRIARPRPLVDDPEGREELFKLAVGKPNAASERFPLVRAYQEAQAAENFHVLPPLIREHALTREMIPTEYLDRAEVWEALLERMPLTALVRNLGVMTKVGLLAPGAAAVDSVLEKLANVEAVKKARIHPTQVLYAMKTYAAGRGFKGSGTWNPVPKICDALDALFDLSFRAVEATGKRILVGVDASGSMTSYYGITGPISPAEGACALALHFARTEARCEVVGYDHRILKLDVSRRRRLDDVVGQIGQGGGTDSALPILYALEGKMEVDVFVNVTDNETHAGKVHPYQALQRYREKTGRRAKLVVVGMTATGFTVSDPSDADSLDVVGFDAEVPRLVADFARE